MTAADSGTWNLTWSEEFDTDGKVDPTRWRHEIGFIRNAEPQYYTDAESNCRIKNGCLHITGLKETFEAPVTGVEAGAAGATQKADYTSASINTRESFLYGRIEARAKIPTGKGSWPAIWMLGENIQAVNWPRCGEIDIMEHVGKEPGILHGTVHYADNENKHAQNEGKLNAEKPYDDFHIYAIEWDEEKIVFFYDETPYFTFMLDSIDTTPENPFRKPHFLLLNLAIGGSWGGEIDDSTLPLHYLINYIRVYQKKEV